MRKMYDYHCACCDHLFEALAELEENVECPECHESPAERRLTGGRTFTTIQATTNTSKRFKAGYVHNFNRPKEKISVSVPSSIQKP